MRLELALVITLNNSASREADPAAVLREPSLFQVKLCGSWPGRLSTSFGCGELGQRRRHHFRSWIKSACRRLGLCLYGGCVRARSTRLGAEPGGLCSEGIS